MTKSSIFLLYLVLSAASVLLFFIEAKSIAIQDDDNDLKMIKIRERLNVNRSSSNPTPQELCEACHYAMPLFRELVLKNETKYFHEIATLVCVTLKLTEDYVCSQAIGLFEVNKIKSFISSFS